MPTAAAKRAAEADEKREKLREYQQRYRARHAEELKAKRREARQRKREEREKALAIEEPFPSDSVIAAAQNQKHGLTIIEAAGQAGNVVVIVEHVYVDGIRYHRVKTTSYSYFRSYKAALSSAKGHARIKIQEYRSVESEPSEKP